MNAVTELIGFFDGLTHAAGALGVTHQCVRKWERGGLPPLRVLRVASATDWKITPHMFRPDVYPHPDDGLPDELRQSCVRSGA